MPVIKFETPDDRSDFRGSDNQSDHAHYNEDSDHDGDFSLSTTGVEEDGINDDDDLAKKKTTGALPELLAGRRVFLVRHGKTSKAPTDPERELAPLAERQCSAFLSAHGADMDRIKYAFASPTRRTRGTSSLLGYPAPVSVPYLYFPNYYTDEMQQLDDELGYAPLSDYFNAKEGRGRDMYEPVQAQLGTELAKVFGKELEKARAMGEWEGDLIIVTHAVTISILALEVLKAAKGGRGSNDGPDDGGAEEDKIMSMNVGEVEGFCVAPNGTVELLRIDIP